MKYYLRILGIWIRVPKNLFYKNHYFWSKQSFGGRIDKQIQEEGKHVPYLD